MSAADFVWSLEMLALQAAAEGHSVERTMVATADANAHQRSGGMTVREMQRRLDRLGDGPGDFTAAALEAAGERAEARRLAWEAAGNTSPVPHAPLDPLPEDARRRARATWRQCAEGRARVLHIGAQSSPFTDLCAIYGLSDADLMATLNRHAWSAPA